MKINPISSHNSFKGLFVDKSKEVGDWRMEYHPYSWETEKRLSNGLWDEKKSIMAVKEKIDFTSPKLPDNEEIYIPAKDSKPSISKDILGTVSYYEYPSNIKNGEKGCDITVMEPLNREESVKVFMKKQEKFKEMKFDRLKEIRETLIQNKRREMGNKKDKFWSNFSEIGSISSLLNGSKSAASRIGNELSMDMYYYNNYIDEYMNIAESLKELDDLQGTMKDELKLIGEAKQKGNIVDISKRHCPDPNKPLWDDLVNLLKKNTDEILSSQKLVLLPHKSVKMVDLLKHQIEYYKQWIPKDGRFTQELFSQISAHVMAGVDYLISHRV